MNNLSSVAIALYVSDDQPAALAEPLLSALRQDYPVAQVIVIDGRGEGTAGRSQPVIAKARSESGPQVDFLAGPFTNRAAGWNAALRVCQATYLLSVDLLAAPVVLRRSAVRSMVMAAARHAELGFVYADYALVNEAAPDSHQHTEVHLLDYHPGRIRETVDFGPALLYAATALRDAGGFDETFARAELYDLRLRLSEHHKLVHIANRYAGSLYEVHKSAAASTVFDYLLDDRTVQLEYERAITDHLRRIGALLVPGRTFSTVPGADQRESNGSPPGKRSPLASVVIPVNQRPQFIGDAIASVLAQTEQRVECIVVVNGGENDPTCAVVREWIAGGSKFNADAPAVRLVVVDVNNIGVSLNSGIAMAEGRYYVQLDSDDRLTPDAVERIVAVFDADPHVGMVVGSYEVWELDEDSGQIKRDERIPVVKHEEWTEENGPNNLLRINGAGAPRAIPVAIWAEMGGFSVNDSAHSRNYGEDYDMVLRVSERYRIGRVWEPIYKVIRHAGGTDHRIDQATIDRNNEAKDQMRLEAMLRRQKPPTPT